MTFFKQTVISRLIYRRATQLKRLFVEELIHRALFLITFVTIWHVVATYPTIGLMPTPYEVGVDAYELVATGAFLYDMGHTLRRVLVAFLFAWAASVFLGIGMGVSRTFEKFADVGVMVGITIPGLAMAIIMVMLFGLRELTAYLAVFSVVTPIITINLWEGAKDTDMKLVEMGKVFDFGLYRTVRTIIFPQVLPYMLSAGRFGLAIAWKITVIVEFLGFGNGIGFRLISEYRDFDMPGVLAWTLLFVIVMLIFEFGGFKVLEWKYLSWRPDVDIRQRGGMV